MDCGAGELSGGRDRDARGVGGGGREDHSETRLGPSRRECGKHTSILIRVRPSYSRSPSGAFPKALPSMPHPHLTKLDA